MYKCPVAITIWCWFCWRWSCLRGMMFRLVDYCVRGIRMRMQSENVGASATTTQCFLHALSNMISNTAHTKNAQSECPRVRRSSAFCGACEMLCTIVFCVNMANSCCLIVGSSADNLGHISHICVVRKLVGCGAAQIAPVEKQCRPLLAKNACTLNIRWSSLVTWSVFNILYDYD